MLIYVIIGIGLIAACYGGYKYGYENGVSDTLLYWEEVHEQLHGMIKDIEKEINKEKK